jgi:hypothetical protein
MEESYNIDIKMNINWSFEIKNKTIFFLKMKICDFYLWRRKLKYTNFIGTKNIFNPNNNHNNKTKFNFCPHNFHKLMILAS